MGKPIAQPRDEIGWVTALFGYYADNGPEMLKETRATVQTATGPFETVARRKPLGVVLCIEPRNGPMYQAM
jgi:succinate-semialdehyde dehydrogenase/glutarate-semialdehyde dehydrogenase